MSKETVRQLGLSKNTHVLSDSDCGVLRREDELNLLLFSVDTHNKLELNFMGPSYGDSFWMSMVTDAGALVGRKQ